MPSWLTAVYRVQGDARTIADRAAAIAVEQSVEMPPEAIADRRVLAETLGRVEAIVDRGNGEFDLRIALAAETTGCEPGQLMNVLFGNTSLCEDAVLQDVELPDDLAALFAGPGQGIGGLRRRIGVEGRALTCSVLKPQGLSPAAFADLARRLALGGIDYLKDDHGLADQLPAPFAERVAAVAAAVREATQRTGHPTHYAPSLSGTLDDLRRQIGLARRYGLDTVLISPMVVGVAACHAIARENRDLAVIAHPAMAGAARIAPPLLYGKLFRLFGADAVVFPHQGGRFGYSAKTCRELAQAARAPLSGKRPTLPVPAGGMTPERVGEIVHFYGLDSMLLVGGGLLSERRMLSEATAAFVQSVAAASAEEVNHAL